MASLQMLEHLQTISSGSAWDSWLTLISDLMQPFQDMTSPA